MSMIVLRPTRFMINVPFVCRSSLNQGLSVVPLLAVLVLASCSARTLPSNAAYRLGGVHRISEPRPGHYWPTQRRDTLPLPPHPVSIPPKSPSYP